MMTKNEGSYSIAYKFSLCVTVSECMHIARSEGKITTANTEDTKMDWK